MEDCEATGYFETGAGPVEVDGSSRENKECGFDMQIFWYIGELFLEVEEEI